MPTVHPRTLEKLDAAGVDVFPRRNGWVWVTRAALAAFSGIKTVEGFDGVTAPYSKAFPTLEAAARDACRQLQIQ